MLVFIPLKMAGTSSKHGFQPPALPAAIRLKQQKTRDGQFGCDANSRQAILVG